MLAKEDSNSKLEETQKVGKVKVQDKSQELEQKIEEIYQKNIQNAHLNKDTE